MSRLKKFAHSLVSGYVALGANILFSLTSVPLALAYLPKTEIGLWAVILQIGAYLSLIDLGMSGVSRILIDYKDHKDRSEYGSVILTTVLVSAVQAGLILLVGVALAFGSASLLAVPEPLHREFTWLMLGQAGFLAGTFLTRVFNYLLAAYQRYDVANYAQAGSFAVSLAVLWVALAKGAGIYSLLYGQAMSWLFSATVTAIWCQRLRLLPARSAWGRPNRKHFWEIFLYGKDIFFFMLGGLMINASQTILISRVLGFDMAAVWTFCTRPLMLLAQIIYRVFDYSCAALAEMIVRSEHERLLRRFKAIVIFSSSLAVVGGIGFAACNQPFVEVWTKGRIAWSPLNDWLLAVWIVISVIARCHLGLVGQAKQFRSMHYVYLGEGLIFVCLSLPVLAHWGVTGVIVTSIVCSLLFSVPYVFWRTGHYFGLRVREVSLGWSRPALKLFLWLGPPMLLLWGSLRTVGPWARLLLPVALFTPPALVLLFRWGVDPELRLRLAERLPGRFRWLLSCWVRPIKTWIRATQAPMIQPDMGAIKNLVRSGRRILRSTRSSVLRRIGLLQGDWNTALNDETAFWEMALQDEGRRWSPEEFRLRMDPKRELQEDLKKLLSTSADGIVRILDVGAGPLTTLGRHWEGHQIEIVAVDPLAEQYRSLLKRLAINPPTETTFAHGEKLMERFQPDQFDLAYSSNALDHSYDPVLAIRQMFMAVKPGCYVYLWHFANEGLTEAYHGLHQWNFDVHNSDFVISDGRRQFSLAREFGSSARLECERQFAYGKPVVIAKLRKL